MECILCTTSIGLVVGTLVGLTGLGGGVVLLPLLIFGLQTPPIIAIGSGATFATVTKIGAAIVHWRHGNVDWKLAGAMAIGSIPGALIGVALLAHLQSKYGESVNGILTTMIGVLLLAIPFLLLFQGHLEKNGGLSLRERLPGYLTRYNGAFFIGIEGGLLVGLTSVGAGSVIILFLLLFYRLTPKIMIGTDIVHAVMLTGVTGLAHMKLGTVDFSLVGWLILGSVPGVLVGSVLTKVISGEWLKRGLMIILVSTGITMLI